MNSEKRMPTKANLGCGEDYRKGWLNVDVREEVTHDRIVDLDNYPWPFEDGRFEHVLMDNVIEHLEDRHRALEELHRVLKSSGTAVIRFPHWNSPGHYTDPTHTKTITHRTFEHGLVRNMFHIENVGCSRVRFGRALPEKAALWLGDHIGHIVSEVEVKIRSG